jgi:molybdenum-dependent DNA-binding transcriptional regulator ModE
MAGASGSVGGGAVLIPAGRAVIERYALSNSILHSLAANLIALARACANQP